MRPTFSTALVVAALTCSGSGQTRAEWPDEPAGFPPPAIVLPMAPALPGPTPAFSSPFGGSQGFGYLGSTYRQRPGLQIRAYYDGTVSSPYRPGSLNLDVPRYGYFATGEGPYVFPPRCPR